MLWKSIILISSVGTVRESAHSRIQSGHPGLDHPCDHGCDRWCWSDTEQAGSALDGRRADRLGLAADHPGRWLHRRRRLRRDHAGPEDFLI
jgi:hypothetical protein